MGIHAIQSHHNLAARRQSGLKTAGLLTGAVLAGVAALSPIGKAKAQEAQGDTVTITANTADRANGDFMINTPAEIADTLDRKLAIYQQHPEDSQVISKIITGSPEQPLSTLYILNAPMEGCGFSIPPALSQKENPRSGEKSMIFIKIPGSRPVGQAVSQDGQILNVKMVSEDIVEAITPADYPKLDEQLNVCLNAVFKQ